MALPGVLGRSGVAIPWVPEPLTPGLCGHPTYTAGFPTGMPQGSALLGATIRQPLGPRTLTWQLMLTLEPRGARPPPQGRSGSARASEFREVGSGEPGLWPLAPRPHTQPVTCLPCLLSLPVSPTCHVTFGLPGPSSEVSAPCQRPPSGR